MLDRVRRRVRAVVACDVFLPNPLAIASDVSYSAAPSVNCDGVVSSPSTLQSNPSLYDVIVSTLCLEFATVTVKDYSLAVANVASLLKPGGHLILQVLIETIIKWIVLQTIHFYNLDKYYLFI